MLNKTFEKETTNYYAPTQIVGRVKFKNIEVIGGGFRYKNSKCFAYITITPENEEIANELLIILANQGNFICNCNNEIIKGN